MAADREIEEEREGEEHEEDERDRDGFKETKTSRFALSMADRRMTSFFVLSPTEFSRNFLLEILNSITSFFIKKNNNLEKKKFNVLPI